MCLRKTQQILLQQPRVDGRGVSEVIVELVQVASFGTVVERVDS